MNIQIMKILLTSHVKKFLSNENSICTIYAMQYIYNICI